MQNKIMTIIASGKKALIMFCLAFLTFFLVGCGPTKSSVLSNIDKRTIKRTPELSERKYEDVSVNYSVPSSQGNQILTLESQSIPAVFFWSWDKKFHVELDGNYNEALMTNRLYKAADSLNLKDPLKGKRLEIEVEQFPGQFDYHSDGIGFFLFFTVSMGNSESIYPDTTHLKLSYKTLLNEKVQEQGIMDIPKAITPLNERTRKNSYHFIWQYLNDYETRIKEMALEAMSGIIKDISE